jgi:hypothetical protein
LAQIANALQSGDLAGAQQAAQNMQSAHASHHHHSNMPTQATTVNNASAVLMGLGTQINTTA